MKFWDHLVVCRHSIFCSVRCSSADCLLSRLLRMRWGQRTLQRDEVELMRESRIVLPPNAGVAELADALDSKSSGRKAVWVRAPPPAVSFGCWTLGVGRSLFKDTNKNRGYLRPSSDYAENNALTDSRESTIIVKTPRIVPKGRKRHSIQAITRANE